MTHELKILKDFADAVYGGDKTFEVRENDRGFQKGDKVIFKAVENKVAATIPVEHPINEQEYRITYVLSGWGIKEGYVVFGIIKESPFKGENGC